MILTVLIALSPIYGVYLNRFRASQRRYLDSIFSRVEEGLINGLIIDIKDDHGVIPYPSQVELAQQIGAVRPSIDLDHLLKRKGELGMFLVGRISVFRDDILSRFDEYAVLDTAGRWRDNVGIGWVDPYNKKVWEYNLAIAQEILDLGFDLIFFDYVRFPSDGDLSRCRYSADHDRFQTIRSFIDYARRRIKRFGLCVFGYSIWRPLYREGQRLEDFKGVYILAPMLYPSHFAPDFQAGEDRPYQIYYRSVQRAKDSLPNTLIIPFIQGFDYLVDDFDADYIRREIEGVIDGGGDGFFIWNAAGDYDDAFAALANIGGRRIAFLIGRGSHREEPDHQSRDRDYRQVRIRSRYRRRIQIYRRHDIPSDILP